ncbi:hypothetical protein AAFF_G00410960 [Aldrovandia affinis]|uniref:DUF4455 domain-containing protein n=1 Tax=Aldrovandia affinis TaxID=143900 RepID=A0AAD7SB80_9TELE|nr:hypothetical protein AAFF_G00410960 [Aldrovandia affinis]
MAEIRVIPSGKVYRQMFDAQVQLSRTLHDTRRRRAANERFLHSDNAPATPGTETVQGISTGVNHALVDMTIRDQLSSGARPLQKIEEQSVEEEVRGLPDTIVAEKLGSDIIKRLAERQERSHAETVAQLHQELSVFSLEHESFLRESADDFLCKLSESTEEEERLIQRMDSDSELNMLTFQDVHKLWDSVKQGSEVRRKRIRELYAVLAQCESERMTVIAGLLKKCTRILETIGHMAASDIHRLIDSEAMMINQAILANRRALARLFLNLTEKDLQRALFHRLRWEDRLQDWKTIKVHALVNEFKEFMRSPQILSPKAVQATLDTLRMEQESLSKRRAGVLRSLRSEAIQTIMVKVCIACPQKSSMVPPKCSEALAAEWYSSLSTVNGQIDSLHINSMTNLHVYYEQTWQSCLVEVDRIKDEAVGYGLSPDKIQDIVSNMLLPLIGQCQTQTEKNLEAMDRAFESLAKRAGALSKTLFRFARGSAHLWEVHSAGLLRREQQLQDQLEELRHAHEQENQASSAPFSHQLATLPGQLCPSVTSTTQITNSISPPLQKKEAELDIMLDRLRQESSEEALRISLEKTLHFLEEIKNRYISLYQEKVDTVCGYPAMVLKEMQTYSMAISQFFKVKEIYSQGAEELSSQSPFINLDVSRYRCEKNKGQTCGAEDPMNSSSHLVIAEDDSVSPEEFCDSQSSETFTTSRGNVYNAQSFGTQSEEDRVQGPTLPEVELVVYPKSLLVELQRDIRVAFYIHLEGWYQTAMSNAVTVVMAKKEELKSGLGLQLQLQLSRAKRIEEDVHNVRAVELVLHRDRVDQHCKVVQDTLSAVRTRVQDLQLRQQEQTEAFRAQIHAMENVFTSATKSDKLASLCDSLQSRLEKHMTVVQKSQRGFRQEAELTLGGLRESNAQFIKSLQLFLDGGNYTPEEIKVFQKRLEKMAKHIDSTDEAIMLEMEGTESRCLEQAKDVISMFEDKFHFLTMDLKFLEKIQRILTNMQVQIKTKAAKSNMQKKT